MYPVTHADVEARVSYIEPGGRKPFAYEYDPPAGAPRRSAPFREQVVRIRNARSLERAPSLDGQGFELRPHATRTADFYDAEEVRRVYYPELEALVRAATGATYVVIFDHTVRGNAAGERGGVAIREPVSRVHNDYTPASALRRARDVTPRERTATLLNRFVQVNVWRPIRGPLQTRPLGLIDATTLRSGDLVACDLIYRERLGEIYYAAHQPGHAWYYYPDMSRDEVLLLKGFDSDASRVRFAPHASFDHPHTPADTPPRESIEARAFAFFA
jgi:hypothetical protein